MLEPFVPYAILLGWGGGLAAVVPERKRWARSTQYTVLEAGEGVEALDLSQSYASRIDLLITDIVMPGMRGPEVASLITQQRRGLGVLFVSGYSEEALSHVPGAKHVSIVEKPYTAESLLRAVRHALDKDQIAAA